MTKQDDEAWGNALNAMLLIGNGLSEPVANRVVAQWNAKCAELKQARDDLIKINNLIFAKGAPLGSDIYFAIREIAAKYEGSK